MGTYSTATPLKVNAAVSNSVSATSTLYTAPSTGSAWVNVSMSGTGTGTVTVGGRTVAVHSNTLSSLGKSSALTTSSFPAIYVGPSQALAFTLNSGAVTAVCSGVEFINS